MKQGRPLTTPAAGVDMTAGLRQAVSRLIMSRKLRVGGRLAEWNFAWRLSLS